MKKTKKRCYAGFKIILLLIVLILFLLYDSNTRIAVNDYPLYFSNLPDSFDGYRIAQLSDIHAAVFGNGNTTLINAVKSTNPDIIVITGDLYDGGDKMDIIEPLVRNLTGIAPVYFITGNHEWDSGNLRDLLNMLDKHGVTILRNDYKRLQLGDDAIILAGIDDPNGPEDMKTPEELISEIRKKAGDPFIVLLAHRNNCLDRFSKLGLDLVLCGHAHGGLVRFPLIGGLIGPSRELFPRYTSGVYLKSSTKMLVSRGIGNQTGFPRFLNNPQIPVIILRKS